ncbi:MAG: 3-oxoacyl-(acyl-carrier-protein) synthase 2 [Elusimicrobia bacterium ADurb.Bin231]|nr:MAG: 3-oxoacyl-(acyl-carrier-protein) synthase 2 [Elusimicrobia bacterium ADurb.Bin231]
MRKKVVITGLGVVSPIGSGKEEFWKSLMDGKSGVDLIKHFDTSKHSAKIGACINDFNPELYTDKKKARRMDRFVQFAFAASKLAVEDSGIDFTKETRTRCGVIIGSGIGGLNTIEEQSRVMFEKGANRISPFFIPMLITNMAAGEVAINYGLMGVNYAITSACASSTHCIGDALRLIRYGDLDVALAGGTEAAITPLGLAGFCSLKALSTRNDDPQKASRPFDAKRDGFIMGEGAGIVVLETEEHAKARGARIYCEIAGYGASDDAYHITAPEPNAVASSFAMSAAISDAGITAEDIDYVNAHGTSTELNDKSETGAIKKVFGEHAKKLAVSSTKSMVGHLLGAAGAVEVIASSLSIERGIIHPTINYEFPDPDCDLDYVPNKPREKKVRAVLKNSLGFGGHNASLVLKAHE